MSRIQESKNVLADNWAVIHHVYRDSVEYTKSGIKNIKLPHRHFDVLNHVIQRKYFKGRHRNDDSLRNAIGNWLDTKQFGSWRNTNRNHTYKANNKELWQDFLHKSHDYSLTQALQHAGR